jgi:phenylalanyl-tRNA synthetase alpha chain
MPTCLSPDQLARDLAMPDLTDPDSGSHAIQLLVDLTTGALNRAWGCIQRRSPGPRIVTIADNYDPETLWAPRPTRSRRLRWGRKPCTISCRRRRSKGRA